MNGLTKPGDIVCDPFAGGGTIPAVAKSLGRQYIGFEIDEVNVRKIAERLAGVTPPLFVLSPPTQLEFEKKKEGVV